MANKHNQRILFNIQRSSIDDGPGVRTVLFFKGCPLRCVWCQNPESQNIEIEYAYTSNGDGQSAKTRIGRSYTLEQVFFEIEQDLVFFESTNGGITFSGGEPTFQLEFLEQLVEFCKSKGIHTVLETCGYFQYDVVLPVLRKIDLIFYDIKAANSEIHKELTGRANEKIIKNLKQLYSDHSNIIVRYVSVPELNSQTAHLNHLAKLLKRMDIPEVSILKYNPLWIDKTRNIERLEPSIKKYSFKEIDSCWENSIRIIKQQGLRIVNTT